MEKVASCGDQPLFNSSDRKEMFMKKLLLLLLPIVAFAQDRSEISRNLELADSYSDRIELARANVDYTPAVRPEASREIMITAERNQRNRDYTPADTRFTEGRMAKVIQAESDKPEATISETRVLVWTMAVKENPSLLELRTNLYPHTYAWYLFKEMETQSVIDAKETLELLKNISQ